MKKLILIVCVLILNSLSIAKPGNTEAASKKNIFLALSSDLKVHLVQIKKMEKSLLLIPAINC